MLNEIFELLKYIGITPDKITPFLILALFIVIILDRKLNPLNRAIRRISNAIIEIQTFLRGAGVPLDHLLTEAPGSPLRPTEYGAMLIRESGLEKILDENKESLLKNLKNSLPKDYTEYDVQETARNVLLSLKEDAMMNPVKEYVYKNALNIETILRVGGLWLRDDFLEQPREIAKKLELLMP